MALTSALFTGLSGLDVNQTRMNVVGNNIANVNTVAFKKSRALFKPQFYVTDQGGAGPSGEFGGTNPSQRGLGAQVAAIEKDFTTGSIEPTGKDTNMAIDGDGFFVVKGSEQTYTRDGSFSLNSANQLVTTSGEFVQGYGVDDSGNVISGSPDNITIPIGSSTTAKATENATLEGNLDASGIAGAGASILTSQLLTTVGGATAPTDTTLLTNIASNTAPTTALVTDGQVFTQAGKKGGRDLPTSTFTVGPTTTVGDFMNWIHESSGIDTSVPDDGNAATPAAGVAFEPDATVTTAGRLVVTGNLGTENALELDGTSITNEAGGAPFTLLDGTNAAGIASNASGESVHTSFDAFDSLGTPLKVDVTAVLESKSDSGNTWRYYASSGDDTDTNLAIGTGTLTFDKDGKLSDSTSPTLTIDRTNTGAATPMSVKLDFSHMTSLTSAKSSLVMSEQDGSEIGTLSSFSVGANGTITGSYTNGQNKTLGQVAVAMFSNPMGLVDKGGNQYEAGADSGVPIITSPLELGAGSIRSGALEMSNVDLSEEFVNMIISSTGFSAASRVISTSDQLINELLNSTR